MAAIDNLNMNENAIRFIQFIGAFVEGSRYFWLDDPILFHFFSVKVVGV